MSEPLPRMSAVKRLFVLLAVGAAVGIAAANSFADAAGIHGRNNDDYIMLGVLCGVVLGLATIALVIVGGHFGALGIAALRQSSRRPSQAMAITLVICGAVCLLMAMAFEWYVVASSHLIRAGGGGSGGSATINLPGMDLKGTVAVDGSGALHLGSAPSPLAHVMALACFAAGAVLIGLGVWSSMSTKPEGHAPEARPAGAPPPNAAFPT